MHCLHAIVCNDRLTVHTPLAYREHKSSEIWQMGWDIEWCTYIPKFNSQIVWVQRKKCMMLRLYQGSFEMHYDHMFCTIVYMQITGSALRWFKMDLPGRCRYGGTHMAEGSADTAAPIWRRAVPIRRLNSILVSPIMSIDHSSTDWRCQSLSEFGDNTTTML